MKSVVISEDVAGAVDDLAAVQLGGVRQSLDERAVIAETDVLTVRPLGDGEREPACRRAHFALCQGSERKERMGELLLREREEKIGLVLLSVDPAGERRASGLTIVHDARVMAGRDIIGAAAAGPFEQNAELEVAVARDARIGRAAGDIFVDERSHAQS